LADKIFAANPEVLDSSVQRGLQPLHPDDAGAPAAAEDIERLKMRRAGMS
jgi:hypothetical protein